MTAARLRAVSGRAAAILAAAHPETDGTYVRRRYTAPVEPEKLKGRRVWVFPIMRAPATAAGTRKRDAVNLTVRFVVTEVLSDDMRNVPGDDGAEEALQAWVDERVDWVDAEICERFGSDRHARALWGEGFETVGTVDGPQMTDVLVAEYLDGLRMFFCAVDFVFQEV